jgi:hypothetical protein
MSPVRYKLGFYIPDDGILHNHWRETLSPTHLHFRYMYITLSANYPLMSCKASEFGTYFCPRARCRAVARSWMLCVDALEHTILFCLTPYSPAQFLHFLSGTCGPQVQDWNLNQANNQQERYNRAVGVGVLFHPEDGSSMFVETSLQICRATWLVVQKNYYSSISPP